jgi:hypothetical protein
MQAANQSDTAKSPIEGVISNEAPILHQGEMRNLLNPCKQPTKEIQPKSPIQDVISNEAPILHRGEMRNLLNPCKQPTKAIQPFRKRPVATIKLIAKAQEISPLRCEMTATIGPSSTGTMLYHIPKNHLP